MAERATHGRLRRARRPAAHLLAVALIGAGLLSVGAAGGLAAGGPIEPQGLSAWNPSLVEIAPGEEVEFKNSSGVGHGLTWQSVPVTPNCNGVPVNSSQTSYSGSCTFPQAGEYNFICYVHPEMQGKVVASGPPRPGVTTGAASAIGDTGATLNGTVNPNGQATTYRFRYGTTTSYGQQSAEQSAGEGTTAVPVSAPIAGLAPATTYHFQLVATNAAGTTLGPDQTFTTTGPPSAITEPATNVGGLSATLVGKVNPNGRVTDYHFEYGTTDAYGQTTAVTSAGGGTGTVTVSAPVTGLTPETTYHFRLVAQNASGPVEGIDRTFTTPGPPLATTGQATAVTDTSATLQGTVNPLGQATDYHFEYGTTIAYGEETPVKAAGSGLSNVPVNAALANLEPGVTYHFRLVAENGSGPTSGIDRTFTTALTPPPPTPPSDPPPAPAPAPSAPAPATPARAVPDTRITKKPPARTRDRTPTVSFRASVAGASFQCSVDRGRFKACRSPYTAPRLKPGRHRIRVRARAAGAVDPTPAAASFRVLGRAKARR